MVAFTGGSFNLATQQQPEQVDGMRATPGWFDMQGIPFLMGRDFLPEEGIPGKDKAVVLTNKLWKRLGADRGIVGHTIRVNNEPYTVVGVLSPGLADRFGFELAAPLAFQPVQINHDYHWLLTMARMKPGVTLRQAQADMDAVTAQIRRLFRQRIRDGALRLSRCRMISCRRTGFKIYGCCWVRWGLCCSSPA